MAIVPSTRAPRGVHCAARDRLLTGSHYGLRQTFVTTSKRLYKTYATLGGVSRVNISQSLILHGRTEIKARALVLGEVSALSFCLQTEVRFPPAAPFKVKHSPCSSCLRGDKCAENHFTPGDTFEIESGKSNQDITVNLVVCQFEFRSEPIPKGFKLIAVGERCATPTEFRIKRLLTLKGSNCDV
jgi:hypothetical protein